MDLFSFLVGSFIGTTCGFIITVLAISVSKYDED